MDHMDKNIEQNDLRLNLSITVGNFGSLICKGSGVTLL